MAGVAPETLEAVDVDLGHLAVAARTDQRRQGSELSSFQCSELGVGSGIERRRGPDGWLTNEAADEARDVL